MSRRPITFTCESANLFGTVDDAPGSTGLLIVSGGNEVRAGAWNGQAQLAACIAQHGHPVMRFDRRGIGDSEGKNHGYESAAPDISAALTAFYAQCPQLKRVIAFGNCDAASALMLMAGQGFAGLVLSNPWTYAANTSEPSSADLRRYYWQRIKNPLAWLGLFIGKVSPSGLIASLRGAAQPITANPLAAMLAKRLAIFTGSVSILLAERDRTAQAFAAIWDEADERLEWCEGASHAFVEVSARDWLEQRLLLALAAH